MGGRCLQRRQLPPPLPPPVFPPGPVAGGYKPVPNAANDAEVTEAARFAVSQINARRNGAPLALVNVTRAATQVVAGLNYSITLTAAAPGTNDTKTFDAVVYRPLGAGAPLQLTSVAEAGAGAGE